MKPKKADIESMKNQLAADEFWQSLAELAEGRFLCHPFPSLAQTSWADLKPKKADIESVKNQLAADEVDTLELIH